MEDMAKRLAKQGIPLSGNMDVVKATGNLNSLSTLTIKFTGIMIADVIYDMNQAGVEPVKLCKKWGSFEPKRIKIGDDGILSIWFAAITAANFYSKATQGTK